MKFIPAEIRLGRKKAYVHSVGDNVEILLDCDVTNALVRINMTVEQFNAWRDPNRPNIQILFPKMPAELREMLMTGITPAEWNETFGEPPYTQEQLVEFGYEFESE